VSITTYAELKTAIADFLNRDDLTTVIPTFISLAEAQIARDVRHWKQEKRVTTSVDERYENLPNDWLEIQLVALTTGKMLQTVSMSEMAAMRAASDTAAAPRYVRLTADQIEFYPTPSAATDISMLYYARIPALSDTETTNWLLADAPDVLLYGALVHSAPYLTDDARAAVWGALYQAGVEKLNLENQKGRTAGPMRMGVPR
jgi:SH3-like domain-containing protein